MIEECPYTDVAQWRRAAARERVALADTRETRWFRYGELACAGLLALQGGARIKGVYVTPEARGKGIGTALTEFLIELARSLGWGSWRRMPGTPASTALGGSRWSAATPSGPPESGGGFGEQLQRLFPQAALPGLGLAQGRVQGRPA